MISCQSAFSNFIQRIFAKKELFNINESEQKTNYQHLKKIHASNPGIDEESIFETHQPQHFKPKLIVISPKKTAQQIPLYPNSEMIIGRHALSDIKINGFGISDFHAKLILSCNKVYIEDLYSKSGTFVDGRRSTPGLSDELADKTTVIIKNYQFQFDIPKPSQPALPEIIEKHSQAIAISDYTCSQLINEYQRLDFWQSSLSLSWLLPRLSMKPPILKPYV